MKIRKMQNAGVAETPHVDLPYQTKPTDNLHHYLYAPKLGEIKISPEGSSSAYLKNQMLNVDINEIPFTTLPTEQYSLRDVQKMAKDDFERGIDGGIAKYDITNPGEINSDENWDYEYWAHRTGLKDNIKKRYINRLIKLHKKDPISAGALLAKYQRDGKVPTNYVLPKTSDGETARQNLTSYYSSPQYGLNKSFYEKINDFAWSSVAAAGMGAANHSLKLYKPLNSLKTGPKIFVSPFAKPSMVSTIGKDMLLGTSLYTAGDIASLAATGNTMLDNINNTVKYVGGDNKVTDFVTNYVTPFVPIIPVDMAASYISRNLPKLLTQKGLSKTSYDLISEYVNSAEKIKRPLWQTDFKSWLKTKEGRHYDWSNYGGADMPSQPYSMDTSHWHDSNKKNLADLITPEGYINRNAFNNLIKVFSFKAKQLGYNNDQLSPINDPAYNHSLDVANSALTSPIPHGSNRQEFVASALLHDIGKFANSYDTPHENIGVDVLKSMIGEDPKYNHMLSTIGNHMFRDNTQVSYWGNHDITPNENYNLTSAVMFADVARGLPWERASLIYPHLAGYKKAVDSTIDYPDNWEDQLKYINKILYAYRYPKIKAKTYEEASNAVNSAILRHNSFLRGVRDVNKNNPSKNDLRSQQSVEQELSKLGLENNYQNRLLNLATMIPKHPTGSGRVGLFNDEIGLDGLAVHHPTYYSKIYKISPNDFDALYVSASDDTAKTYSDISKSKSGNSLAAVVSRNLDLSSENLLKRWVDNEFLILDHDRLAGRSLGPISSFNKFKLPYMIQTGKAFSTEYEKYLKSIGVKQFKKIDNFEPIEGVSDTNEYRRFNNALKSLDLERYKNILMFQRSKDGGLYWSQDKAANELQNGIIEINDKAYNLFERIVSELPDFVDDEIINKKTGWIFKKARREANKLIHDYIEYRKNNKIMPHRFVLSDEYNNALRSNELMGNFMKSLGLKTVESMPYFNNDSFIISTNGNWGQSPFSLGKTRSTGAPHVIIPGKKGSYKLNFVGNRDVNEATSMIGTGRRDIGSRSLNGITMKTWKGGGKLKTNKAE